MRRGHSGTGGWRNENHRHFAPRGGGAPHFRSSRPFGSSDSLRFPTPGPRFRGFTPYSSHKTDNHERFHGAGHHTQQMRPQERSHNSRDNRQILPLIQQARHNDINNSFSKATSYYDEGNNYNVNQMGDVDLRQTPGAPQNRDTFNTRQMSTWINSPFETRPYYNEHKSPHKTNRHHNASESMTLNDYTGHRPPASDYYAATPGPNNNNTPYSHSVDDTVDIVRRRLMNRESQQQNDEASAPREMDEDLRVFPNIDYHVPEEQPTKKKNPKHKPNIKSNCAKMKDKIVNQLFKMDKGKIHKLMDNPSSSSKFEYAISSLITESQNSLNRHLRSVAEKSLECNSSSDFINNDNNTIYEDTFMKQMQCILDPQDTVLLEDIKPLVLAELSKVLQLDDFQRYEGSEDQSSYSQDDQVDYMYHDEHNDQYPHNDYYDGDPIPEYSDNNVERNEFDHNNCGNYNNDECEEDKPLFERRPIRQECTQERLQSTESRQYRKSIEKSNEKLSVSTPAPLFDPNVEQLSEDDDPFAEFDKQYHVAVDHNFIEQDDVIDLISSNKTPPQKEKRSFSHQKSTEVKKEIDSQLYKLAKSPIKLFTASNTEDKKPKIKCEVPQIESQLPQIEKSSDEPISSEKTESNLLKVNEPSPTGNSKSTSKPNSRKRSIDQKASHRKEKRKKSSHSESQDAAKSIFNMFFSNEPSNENSKTSKKESSEKFVKRKETSKKTKEPDCSKSDTHKKQHNSSHSISSPNENISKTKLTSIDMFIEQPKKASAHQVHKCTIAPLTVVKSPDENKLKVIPPVDPSCARKLFKRHVGTQVIRKYRDKDIQTEKNKSTTRGTQTDTNSNSTKAIDQSKQILSKDPFERMKQIDLEIQVLLQEKFKLYNSLESKSSNGGNTMESLGMTVLNMPVEDNCEGRGSEENSTTIEDTIVDDFTNIPVEELEQIALETVQDTKRRPHRKIQEQLRKSIESPPPKRSNRKVKTPNISLLEQIITDDRPIEDIISLDAFETTPVKSKKKPHKSAPKKKSKKSHRKQVMNRINETNPYKNLKDCSVLLIRTDINKFLNRYSQPQNVEKSNEITSNQDEESNKIMEEIKENAVTEEIVVIKDESIKEESEDLQISQLPDANIEENIIVQSSELIEEDEVVCTGGNDLQFDMLDVSEDIVIGDSSEMKSEKEIDKVPMNDGIILDNCQSSIEVVPPETSASAHECKIYDYSSDESLKKDSLMVTGNADSVLAIECIDNDFIAACLDGNVYHFRGDGQLVNTLKGSNLGVTCLIIVKEKYGTTVYTGSLDSRIRYYDLDTGLEKGPECNVLSPIQTMDRAWDTVFVGTRTGFVLQFECKNNMLIPVSTVKFSEQSILALRAMKEGPRKVLLVAARSEDVTIKDAQTGLLLRTLAGPKLSVYTLLLEDGKVYCGTSSHRIHVFDYASGSHVGCYAGGKGAVCLRAGGGLVFAGCYDGCVYVFREGEPSPRAMLRGPSHMLLSLALHGTKIIAGYQDRSLYIWKIPLPILQEMIL